MMRRNVLVDRTFADIAYINFNLRAVLAQLLANSIPSLTHDNARPHTANVDRNFLDIKEIPVTLVCTPQPVKGFL